MMRVIGQVAVGLAVATVFSGVARTNAETMPPEFGISTLKAVCVQIEPYDSIPLDSWQAELEETVRKRLAKAGVPIVGAEQCFRSPKNALVFFSLHGTRSRSGKLVGYHVSVGLLEQGRLVRAPDVELSSVTTWENWSSGLCEATDLEGELRRSVLELADMFASIFRRTRVETELFDSGGREPKSR